MLSELARLSQSRIFEQRAYEFKISLAVWGAFAAAIVSLSRADIAQHHRSAIEACTALLSATILFVYWYWLSRLVKRYDLFKRQLHYCQLELAALAQVEFPTYLKEEGRFSRSLGLDWGTWPKLLLAVALAIVAVVFAFYLRDISASG